MADEQAARRRPSADRLVDTHPPPPTQDANPLTSAFLANMSHELRTPLNAVIGFADLLYKGKVGPLSAEQHEYLGDILASSKHLLHLINDVLDLARADAGKLELRPRTVELTGLVGEVRDMLGFLAASKRLRLAIHVDPEVRTVVVDPTRVKQILYNCLSNAIRFTPEEGTIRVSIGAEGHRHFRIDVEDTSLGSAHGHGGAFSAVLPRATT
jgi:signal transduction histidine kinase